MKKLYINVAKYTIIYLIVIYFLFMTIGYQNTADLAYLIGYNLGIFGFIYLPYRALTRKKRRLCPHCKRPVSSTKTELAQKESKETKTKKLVDLLVNSSSKDLAKFDIMRQKVGYCERCEKKVVLKSKLYVISTVKVERYISKNLG